MLTLIRTVITNSEILCCYLFVIAKFIIFWMDNLYFFDKKCNKIVVIFFIILYNQKSMITYDEKKVKGDGK